MKRTPLRKVSAKQQRRQRNLAKIKPPEDGRCEVCKNLADWRGLSKHHRKFRSHGGGDTRDNLVWLCGNCTAKEHHIREV